MHAQEGEEEETTVMSFDEYFEKAKEAYVAKDYATAIPLLQKAYLVSKDARVFLNLALAYDKNGECHKAIVYHRALLGDEGTDEKRKQRSREEVERLLKECKTFDENLAGRLVVVSKPAGARVYIDGVAAGTTPMEAPALVRGKHEVRVLKGELPPVRRSVTLEPEQDLELSVDLEAKEPAPEDTVKALPEEVDDTSKKVEEPSGSGVNVPAIVLLGAGAVSLGVAAYFDFVAIPDADDERRQLVSEISRFGTETPERQSREARFNELTDDRNLYSTVAVAGYVAGGVLVGAGAGWLIYDALTGSEGDVEGGAVTGVSWGPGFKGAFMQVQF